MREALVLLLLAGVVAVGVGNVVEARTTYYAEACYICENRIFGYDTGTFCVYPPSYSNGDGISCKEIEVSIPPYGTDTTCIPFGAPCYYFEVPGGGGGGGGGWGGGGTDCTRQPGTGCPTFCMSCTYY